MRQWMEPRGASCPGQTHAMFEAQTTACTKPGGWRRLRRRGAMGISPLEVCEANGPSSVDLLRARRKLDHPASPSMIVTTIGSVSRRSLLSSPSVGSRGASLSLCRAGFPATPPGCRGTRRIADPDAVTTRTTAPAGRWRRTGILPGRWRSPRLRWMSVKRPTAQNHSGTPRKTRSCPDHGVTTLPTCLGYPYSAWGSEDGGLLPSPLVSAHDRRHCSRSCSARAATSSRRP